MNKLSTLGSAILLALLLAACGTGNRLDTDADFDPNDGESGGGQFLPFIGRIDTGMIGLDDGYLDTGKAAPNETNVPRIVIPNATTVEYYDAAWELPDANGNYNGIIDFMILTLRPLSAHAASNVTAFRDDAQVDPAKFIKVGGAMLLPQGVAFDPAVQLTLPIHSRAGTLGGETLDLYVFVDDSHFGRSAADDIGTDTGHWEYAKEVEVDDTGAAVTFNIDYANGEVSGQYAIVTDEISGVVHDSGGGEDV
jgi:hypothetical protein